MAGRKAKLQDAQPFPEAAAERVAKIFGEGCAADLALKEMRRRRAAGEDVAMFWGGETILVGPSM